MSKITGSQSQVSQGIQNILRRFQRKKIKMNNFQGDIILEIMTKFSLQLTSIVSKSKKSCLYSINPELNLIQIQHD